MIRAKLLRAMSVSPGREHERTGFGTSFMGSARFDTGGAHERLGLLQQIPFAFVRVVQWSGQEIRVPTTSKAN
jgi:hypothetical protein